MCFDFSDGCVFLCFVFDKWKIDNDFLVFFVGICCFFCFFVFLYVFVLSIVLINVNYE